MPTIEVFSHIPESTDNYIVTHDGFFHADEVVAIALYAMATQPHRDKPIVVIRTRDERIINGANCCIDVGNKYDQASFKFDHHQKDHPTTHGDTWYFRALPKYDDYDPSKIKLASAGMIWEMLGLTIVEDLWNEILWNEIHPVLKRDKSDMSSVDYDKIVASVAASLIAPIDAVDNGQMSLVGGMTRQTTLSHMISGFNPDPYVMDGQDFNDISNNVFENTVDWIIPVLSKTIGDTIIRHFKMVEATTMILTQSDEQVVVLEKSVPWKEVMVDNWDSLFNVQLLVYPHPSGNWYVQTAIADKCDPQSMRCKAPNSIAGQRGDDLDSITGLSGCNFVHPAGFIGGAKDKETAIQLAKWWVKEATNV